MSTFGGRMNEYDLISIDRFDGANLESSAYFLSHKHADHLIGLANASFAYRLSSNKNIHFYCSPVTKELLSLDARFVALDLDVPKVIRVFNPVTDKSAFEVTVTLLSAAHCPGSVMFFFEGFQGNVLYTGDFRLCVQDVMGMEALHHATGRPKTLRSLYIDTTFCVPQALFIPSRQDCVSAVIDIIQEWLDESPNHCVYILCKATLGYEHLFVEVCKHFRMPIHVEESKFRQYERIGDLADYVTHDPSLTRIHACRCHNKRTEPAKQLPCGHNSGQVKVRTIAVSTLCFVQHVGVDIFTKRYSENFFRACYSFHSSYSEIREMVQYLKPLRAFANVAPDQKIQKTLDGFVASASDVKQNNNSEEFKLGRLKKTLKRRMRQSSEGLSSDHDSQLFGDSPVFKIKKKTSTPQKELMSTPEKFPALFSASCISSEEEEEEDGGASDADMFEDVDWIKEDISSQGTEDFGEHCSMLIDEGEEEEEEKKIEETGKEKEDKEDCSQQSNQTVESSPSLLTKKKVVDLTLSSLESDVVSQNCDLIDITSSPDL